MTPVDRRRAVRVALPLEVEYETEDGRVRGRIADLSEAGMFVESLSPPPAGSRMSFSFELADGISDEAIAGRGRVSWVLASEGMGVEFEDLSDEALARLKLSVTAVYFGRPEAAKGTGRREEEPEAL